MHTLGEGTRYDKRVPFWSRIPQGTSMNRDIQHSLLWKLSCVVRARKKTRCISIFGASINKVEGTKQNDPSPLDGQLSEQGFPQGSTRSPALLTQVVIQRHVETFSEAID